MKKTSSSLYKSLMLEMKANGHTVTVVAPRIGTNETGLFIENGIKVLRVKTLKLFNVGIVQKGIC